jgi:NAD(P)-dependent dehydrogenase (short-subunit alcohol dehydrogenase family)
LGAAVAGCLGAQGAALVLAARTAAALQKVSRDAEAAGGSVRAVSADVADPAACETVVAAALQEFGRIDGLVNNAGVVQPLALTAEADPDVWRRCVAVNLFGPFYMVRAALGALRRSRGRVINVSSGAAATPLAGAGAYCASKAALNHFTRVLAAEEPGVTAVAVRPGVVDTPMQSELRNQGKDGMPPDLVDYYHRLKAENRLEPPAVPGEAIARLVLTAPAAWSGRFIDYDDPEISSLATGD